MTVPRTRRTKEFGGTILGIVLGILFGLAVAVAVALYVGKVPVPFTSHNQPRSAEQDAAELERNRNWDPNAPLSGGGTGGAGRPPAAAGDVGGVRPPAQPTEPVAPVAPPAPVLVPEAPAVTPAEPPKSAASKPQTTPPSKPSSSDPVGDLLRERAGRAASSDSADPFTYYVQAGAFRAAADAEAQRARLSLLGIQSRVTEREQAGRTVYRVRIGPFDQKDAADRAKAQLDSNSVDAALVRVQR